MDVEIRALALAAHLDALGDLRGFYGDVLGLPSERDQEGTLNVTVGRARLAFRPAQADAFYHFALLIPGDRFEPAARWLETKVELLRGQDGSYVFDFASWRARAAYFLDPAGNIVELIAHQGVDEAGLGEAAFQPSEIVGVSEAGIVAADLEAAADVLQARAGVEVWDGDPSAGLAFVGRRAHTLILCPAGRGWMPTGRPAEAHPVEVTLRTSQGQVVITGDDAGDVRVTSSPSSSPLRSTD